MAHAARRLRSVVLLGAACLLGIVGVLTVPAHAAAGQGGNTPPGNNGTIKVDGIPIDPGNDNDPHLDCGLTIGFFGYDGGPQSATISLTPVAPTPGGNPYQTSASWNIGTRTSGNQFDASVTITAADLEANSTFAGVTPQAQQGFHVRIEVEVTGSQGSDDKFKVVWLNGCASSTTTTTTSSTTTSTTTTSTTTSTTVVSTSTSSTTPTTSATSAGGGTTTTIGVRLGAGGGTTTVPGSPPLATAGPTPAALASGPLAFTGFQPLGLAAAGAGMIAAGVLLVHRRRQQPGEGGA